MSLCHYKYTLDGSWGGWLEVHGVGDGGGWLEGSWDGWVCDGVGGGGVGGFMGWVGVDGFGVGGWRVHGVGWCMVV